MLRRARQKMHKAVPFMIPSPQTTKNRGPSPGSSIKPAYQNAWRMPMCRASLLPLLPGAAWLVAPVRA